MLNFSLSHELNCDFTNALTIRYLIFNLAGNTVIFKSIYKYIIDLSEGILIYVGLKGNL
jgi:hypothetical protein